MARIPNLNEMRNAHREQSKIVARFERMEKQNKRLSITKHIVSAVILTLIIVPIKSDDPGIEHGIITWCAIAAFFVVQFFSWRRKAPLTRWRNVKSKALIAALTLIVMPFILMLFHENTPSKWELYYLLWGGSVIFLILFVVGRVMYRRTKAETEEEVERIRRREQRRKRLEML